LTNKEIVDVLVHPSSASVGKMVSEICVPTECRLISIRRESQTELIKGDTVIRPYDRITALIDTAHVDELKEALDSAGPPTGSSS